MAKKQAITIRSSAAEYLTFVAATGENTENIDMRYEDENIWLTQKMLATLYDVSVPAINQHIKKIFADSELESMATIKKYLIVQREGERQIQREVIHYNLQMIIAVGFKINNQRAVRFRAWANQIVQQYTIKGWVIDVERHKNGGTLTEKYFDEHEVLKDSGKITAEIAKEHAETEFEKYRVIQDRLFMSDFDKFMIELEEKAKTK